MDFFIVRTFDRSALYYELRLLLVLVAGSLVLLQAWRKGDRRYGVAFLAGGLLSSLTEGGLQWLGLRGEDFGITLLGWEVPPVWRAIFQGIVEGTICGSMALWVADLRVSDASRREWAKWGLAGGGIALLSTISGVLAAHQPISSIRPLFAPAPIFAITTIIFGSLLLAWRKDALPALATYFMGLLLFAILTLAPLHLLGARWVAVGPATAPVAVSPLWQAVLTGLSLIYEAGGGRLHYFSLPFLLGLLPSKRRAHAENDTLSYHQLRTLTERGWRKRSKPFDR